MSKKTAFVAVGLLLAGVGSPAADSPPQARDGAKRIQGKVLPYAPRPLSRTPEQVLGTITYDTGVNAGFHPDGIGPLGNLNRTVGNRFNSALNGPLLMTGMVNTLTVFPANDGSQSVSIADRPTTMHTANVLYFVNVDLVANQFNVIQLEPSVTVGPDFLGMFIGFFGSTQNGLLGMSDMAVNHQRFHAVQAFYDDGLQTQIQVVPRRNAMLRATVDILAPVELIDFRIQ